MNAGNGKLFLIAEFLRGTKPHHLSFRHLITAEKHRMGKGNLFFHLLINRYFRESQKRTEGVNILLIGFICKVPQPVAKLLLLFV